MDLITYKQRRRNDTWSLTFTILYIMLDRLYKSLPTFASATYIYFADALVRSLSIVKFYCAMKSMSRPTKREYNKLNAFTSEHILKKEKKWSREGLHIQQSWRPSMSEETVACGVAGGRGHSRSGSDGDDLSGSMCSVQGKHGKHPTKRQRIRCRQVWTFILTCNTLVMLLNIPNFRPSPRTNSMRCIRWCLIQTNP